MQMATAGSWMRGRSFALRAVAWSIGLFGVLRLDWVETHGLLPLTQFQAWLGVGLCGLPVDPSGHACPKSNGRWQQPVPETPSGDEP